MKFFHASSRTITSAASLLAIAALLSRILGLLRDRILAGKFGAGDELDIYFAAFRVPDLVYNVVIAGAISAAFIPVFISLYSKDKKKAWQVANNFLNIALLSLLALSALFILLTPLLVSLVAPGFDEEKMARTVLATRIMFLSPLFLGASAILGGILHSFKRFFSYALASIFYNIGIILGAVFLGDSLGVYGLAIGVVLGSFLHLVIQIPSVRVSGFVWRAVLNLKDKSLWKIFFLVLPRSLGYTIFQLNLWVITAIASVLPAGSVAIFNLANHLQFLPIGIIGYSFATAAMPSFAKSVVNAERDKLAAQFTKTVRLILFFVLPLSVLMFVLRAHIVRIAFGTGEFDWAATRLTAAALGIFCLGIWAHSLIPSLSKVFYAFQNTKTPVIMNSIGFGANIALSLFFVFFVLENQDVIKVVSKFLDLEGIESISLLGLPLAFGISGIINFVILLVALKSIMREIEALALISYAVKIFFISLLAGIGSYLALSLGALFLNTATALGILVQAAFASILGGGVYIGIMLLLRSAELTSLLTVFKRKLSEYPHEQYPNGRNGGVV